MTAVEPIAVHLTAATVVPPDDAGSSDFMFQAAPYRRELLAHCYRMVGSVHDAEDLVQETFVRGWRSFDRFEGRSSLRVWLYKIATMACLSALETRRRRPLPSGLSAPTRDFSVPLVVDERERWLEPAADAEFVGLEGDPADRAAARAGIRLAFVAALQYLTVRQRVVLLLRDVLCWRAAEVAELLGTTATAVNSSLRRARAQLAAARPVEDDLMEPEHPQTRALLDRYVVAFENADVVALVGLLRADAELEMPPFAIWFQGADVVGDFLATTVLTRPGQWRVVASVFNGQPAVVVSTIESDGTIRHHGVQVLSMTSGLITRIVAFNDLT